MDKPLYRSQREKTQDTLESGAKMAAGIVKVRSIFIAVSAGVAGLGVAAAVGDVDVAKHAQTIIGAVKENQWTVPVYMLLGAAAANVISSDFLSARQAINHDGRMLDALALLKRAEYTPARDWFDSVTKQHKANRNDARDVLNMLHGQYARHTAERYVDGAKKAVKPFSDLLNTLSRSVLAKDQSAVSNALSDAPLSHVSTVYGLYLLGVDKSPEGRKYKAHSALSDDILQELLNNAPLLGDGIEPYSDAVKSYFSALAGALGEDVKYVLPALREGISPDMRASVDEQHYDLCKAITVSAQRHTEHLLLEQVLQETQANFGRSLEAGELKLRDALILMQQAKSVLDAVAPAHDATVKSMGYRNVSTMNVGEQVVSKLHTQAEALFSKCQTVILAELSERVSPEKGAARSPSEVVDYVRSLSDTALSLHTLKQQTFTPLSQQWMMPPDSDLRTLQSAGLDLATHQELEQRMSGHEGLKNTLSATGITLSEHVKQLIDETHTILSHNASVAPNSSAPPQQTVEPTPVVNAPPSTTLRRK